MADIRTSNLSPGVQIPNSQGYNVPQPSTGTQRGSSEGYRGGGGGGGGGQNNQGYAGYTGSGEGGRKKAPPAPSRPPPPGRPQNTPQYPPSTAPQQYSVPQYNSSQYNEPKPATGQQYPANPGNRASQDNSGYESARYEQPPKSNDYEHIRRQNINKPVPSKSSTPVKSSTPPTKSSTPPTKSSTPPVRNTTKSSTPTAGGFADIGALPPSNPTPKYGTSARSPSYPGTDPRISSPSRISLASDRSSAALNPGTGDSEEDDEVPQSPLGRLLRFLDAEFSLAHSPPASLNTWISFWILPFSVVVYVTAFATVGWAEVDSQLIPGSPVKRLLGLWQLCHNISGCAAITGGDIGGSSGYRAAQTFSVFALLALLCTLVAYSCYVFYPGWNKTTRVGYFALGTRVATVLFLLLTFAIYADHWYQPAFVGGSYTRSLRYSHSLCIVAFVTELLALVFMALEVYNKQHERLHITSLKQLEELASKQALDEDMKRSSRAQNGWEEMPDRSSRAQNGWEEMPDRSSRAQNGWEEMPDRSSRAQIDYEEMPDRSSRAQIDYEEMPDIPRQHQNSRAQEQTFDQPLDSNPQPQAPQRKVQGRRSMKKAQNQSQYNMPQPQRSSAGQQEWDNPTYNQQPRGQHNIPPPAPAPASSRPQSSYTVPQPSYQGQGSRSSGQVQGQGSRLSGQGHIHHYGGATNQGLDV